MSTKEKKAKKEPKVKKEVKIKEPKAPKEPKEPKAPKTKKIVAQPSPAEMLTTAQKELVELQMLQGDLQGELIGVRALDVARDVSKVVELVEGHLEEVKENIEDQEDQVAFLMGPTEVLRVAEKKRARLEEERSAFETQLQKIRPLGFKTIVHSVDEAIAELREEQDDNDMKIEEFKQKLSA